MSTEMVDFYRVAHSERTSVGGRPRGPYRGHYNDPELSALGERLADAHCDATTHPIPLSDGLGWVEPNEVCGFASIADLETWFDGWLAELAKHGYRRYHYRVPVEHVRTGGHQILAFASGEPCAVDPLV